MKNNDNKRSDAKVVVNDLLAEFPGHAREILIARDIVLEDRVELFHGGHAVVTEPGWSGSVVYHIVKEEEESRCECGHEPAPCSHVMAAEIVNRLPQQS